MGNLYDPIGLYRLMMCSAGTLSTTPAGVVLLGSREDDAAFDITAFQPGMSRGRKYRNKLNYRIFAKSKQFRLRELDWLLNHIKNGFDAQVVGEPESGIASGGIFNFPAATKQLGVDFVYRLNGNKRECEVILEGADQYEVAKAFIDAADAGASLTPSLDAMVGNERGENLSAYEAPYFGHIKYPNDTALVSNEDEILDRVFEIRTINRKSVNNKSRTIYLGIKLELTLASPSVSKWVEILNKNMSSSFSFREYLGNGTNYEQFDFGENVLTIDADLRKGARDGFTKVRCEGEITLAQLGFGYGTENGGVGVDVGEEGFDEAEALQGGVASFTF